MNVRDTSPHFLFPQTIEKLSFSEKNKRFYLNTPACRLSGKTKSIKRKSSFEKQTPFCGQERIKLELYPLLLWIIDYFRARVRLF